MNLSRVHSKEIQSHQLFRPEFLSTSQSTSQSTIQSTIQSTSQSTSQSTTKKILVRKTVDFVIQKLKNNVCIIKWLTPSLSPRLLLPKEYFGFFKHLGPIKTKLPKLQRIGNFSSQPLLKPQYCLSMLIKCAF